MPISQEFRTRGGEFQGNQLIDVIVDSRLSKFYLGFEAKKGNASSSNKFYFSNHYPREQIEDEREYGERSGRDIFVAVRIDDATPEGETFQLLFPIQYFYDIKEAGEPGVEWSQLVEDGIDWTDGMTEDTIDQAANITANI